MMTNTTNERLQLFAVNELLCPILTHIMSNSDVLAFASDPGSFIGSSLNIDTGDVSLLVVENDSATINLALPYYSDLEQISAEAVNELDMDDISGGEILISIFAISGAVAACAVAGSIGVGTAAVTGIVTAAGVGIVTAAAIAGGAVGATVVTGIAVGGAAGHRASKGQNLNGSDK